VLVGLIVGRGVEEVVFDLKEDGIEWGERVRWR